MNKKVLLVIFTISIISCSNPYNNINNNNGNKENLEAKKSHEENFFNRDRFEELFLGKPREFVEKRLGKANIEQELFAINATWLWYKHKTYLNSPDALAEWVKIKFNDFATGIVMKINYE